MTDIREPTPPLEVRQEVDQLCDEFEQAFATNAEVRVEGYLQRVAQAYRGFALEQLLPLECELRGRTATTADLDELRQRFPDQPQVVESVLVSEATQARPPSPPTPQISESPGTTVGPYRLMEAIGEGGMGIVYVAEQREPVKRRVALKIIKPGMDTREVMARFEAERQALAMMDHLNIARVLDAGATESGRPYFVMELVKGIPITDFCDEHKLAANQRLALFIDVCHAIQHAHQKGIIHRDIKPSNVLVTSHDGKPVVKVIDFGVAKAINQQLTERTIYTRLSQMVGTPLYMSPEQATMSGLDIDTRTDIYSLGVLLYELLTGHTPLDRQRFRQAAYEEMQRIIREEEPRKPSTKISTLGDAASTVSQQRQTDPRKLAQTLKGDLDWIVMKSLEKDRSRRYETANGFALDVKRFLDHEPVLASPPSTTYRLQKFVQRNRGAVMAGTLVAGVLLLGLLGTSGGMIWALREKARADVAARSEAAAKVEVEERVAELEQVTGFQATQLADIDVEQMGLDLRQGLLAQVRTALAQSEMSADEVDRQLQQLNERLGEANFTNLALDTLHHNIFQPALAAIDAFQDQPQVQARLWSAVGNTLRHLGLLDAAVEPSGRALETFRATQGDDHPDTLSSLANLALLRMAQGKYDEAETRYRQALEGKRRVQGDDHPDTLSSLNSLAALLYAQGKYDEAEPLYRQALEGRQRVLGEEHPDTLSSLNNLALLRMAQGKYDEAETRYRQALEGKRRVLGDDHPDTLNSLNNLALLLKAQGKYDEAEPLFRQDLEGCRRVLGDDHPSTLTSLNNLAALLYAQGKYDEAETRYRQALEGQRRVLEDEHPDTLTSLNGLAALLKAQGKYDEAETLYRQVLEGRQRVLGEEHPGTLTSLNNLALLRMAQGKYDEAETRYRQALEGRRRVLGDDHPDTLDSLNNLAALLYSQGKYDEAETLFRQDLEGSRRVLGDDHPDTLTSLNNLAALLYSLGKYDEAESLYRQALEGDQRVLGEEHPDTLTSLNNLAALLKAQGKYDEAETRYRQALEGQRRVLGEEHPDTLASLNGLAALLKAQGKYDEAETLFRQDLEGCRRVLGDDHPDTLNSLNSLAALLYAQGKYDEAETLYRQVLEGRQRVLGNQHTRTLSSMVALGRIWIEQGNYDQAEELLRECLAGRRAMLEKGNWLIANTTSLLGEAIFRQGRYAEAESLLVEGYRDMDPPAAKGNRKTEALQRLIEFYEAWHEAEPDAGHDQQAEPWKAQLPALEEEPPLSDP